MMLDLRGVTRHISDGGIWENQDSNRLLILNRLLTSMRKSDVTCPKCQAGYRRIELTSKGGAAGEFRCLVCNEVLERMDGSTDIAFRLTVQPNTNSYAF